MNNICVFCGGLEIEGVSCTNVMAARIIKWKKVEAFSSCISSRGSIGKKCDICSATSKALRKEPDQLDVVFLLYVVPGDFPFRVFEQSFRTWISGIKLGGQESFEMV